MKIKNLEGLYVAIDDLNNIIAEGNDKNEIIKDIKLFSLIKTEYGVKLIKS